MNPVGDEDAVRSGVYVIESREYVDSEPELGTSLFDDPAKLRRAMRNASRSLLADKAAIEDEMIAEERARATTG